VARESEIVVGAEVQDLLAARHRDLRSLRRVEYPLLLIETALPDGFQLMLERSGKGVHDRSSSS
jgi:hypothetical protein